MRNQLRTSATALVFLLASVEFAATAGESQLASKNNLFLSYAQQHRLFLNGAQEHFIFQHVSKLARTKETVPPGFTAEIGHVVPNSIKLHRFPSDVTKRVWAVTSYDYAMLQNQLLIINPQDRRVVDIVTSSFDSVDTG
jgi:hypothetical protein